MSTSREKVILYLQSSLECYKSLLSLAQRQKELLLSEKYDRIEDIIDKKDRLIKKIKNLDRGFNKDGVNLITDGMINRLSTELTGIIQHLIKIEDKSREIAAKKRDKIKERLYTIYKGKRMLSTYAWDKKGVARFLDIKR